MRFLMRMSALALGLRGDYFEPYFTNVCTLMKALRHEAEVILIDPLHLTAC